MKSHPALGLLLFTFIILLPATVNSRVTYTVTIGITPIAPVVTFSDPDSAAMLKDITAESGADSSASDYEDIQNLMTDNDLGGSKEIFNYAENNKDYAQWYRLNSESSDYSKVEIRVYMDTLEVTPYQWRAFVYQSDANNINTGYYVDGSSSATGLTTIDVSSIIHQLDNQGFMKVRIISRIDGSNEGKKALISEMEWKLTT